jgi:single-stranded-DNA-specific exonuclease
MTLWLDPQPINTSSLQNLELHPLVAETLIRRGIDTPDAARAFLDPLQSPPAPPSALPGMDKACQRIMSAIRDREPICVWGDFDVDGQTATTLLLQSLQALGADVNYHIPIRATEGHGVNLANLSAIIDHGAKLILTCDTGIAARQEVEFARARGVDFVITDHHDLPEDLPKAFSMINSKLLPGDHPSAHLPGVGVAYKLAEALFENRKSDIPNVLDLVALGIIADVALLQGETRSLAQKGIQSLRKTERLGLKTIAELTGTNLNSLTEETIGFTFAPRLNALGRLSDPNPAVELLITHDPARARLLAAQIEGLNIQRKLLTAQVLHAAEAQLRSDPALSNQPVILLSHPGWPAGVIGIVASHLVERYHKPAILLTLTDGGILHASARSIEGLHITEAIAACKNLLLGFGGHPMAAGFSLEADKLPEFRKSLNKVVEKILGEIITQEPSIQIDAWLDFKALSFDLAASLESMAPFGAGNPPLNLAVRGLTLSSATPIGKAKEHLKLVVTDENKIRQEVLWWNGTDEEQPDGVFDLAYSLRAETFRGERRLTLEWRDFRLTQGKAIEIRKPVIEIQDLRHNMKEFERLKSGMLIWAEGADRSKGHDRNNLYPADEFAIWTTPPSPFELHTAIEIVKPKTIYLFAAAPAGEKTDEFLTRLAGMAKFAIHQRSGIVKVTELAASHAQRTAAVRLGFEWLAAGGHLVIEGEENELHLANGAGVGDPYLQRELYIAIKGILDETSAYRKHFATAAADTLINL